MQHIHPIKNCVSCSRGKIVWKVAYLGVKLTSLGQKHNIVRKVNYLGVKLTSLGQKHNIVRKVAYLGVKLTSLVQKHNIVRKVNYLGAKLTSLVQKLNIVRKVAYLGIVVLCRIDRMHNDLSVWFQHSNEPSLLPLLVADDSRHQWRCAIISVEGFDRDQPVFCSIAVHAALTARDFFLAYFYPSGPFSCIVSKTSPDFFFPVGFG